ncbi:hypothetical protein [Halococcus sp. AFM35]|uniref:hypothetical protein n=1 Tax=Halococcus sp. AFM35 TaxID=3421653 RepID=UPI003EBE132E
MKKRQRRSKRRLFEDFAGSISVALIEIELFTLPFWLGYAIFLDLDSLSSYFPAWVFTYWISIAVYIGIERIVSAACGDENWLTPDTWTDVLMSMLTYGGIGIIVVFFTTLLWNMTSSFPLVLAFCIFSSMFIFRSFKLSIGILNEFIEMRSGA